MLIFHTLTLPRAGQNLDDQHTPYQFPKLVPLLVGNLSPQDEAAYGKVLAPYLSDPTSVFIASSDFCHWGSRFSYTYYQTTTNTNSGKRLGSRDATPTNPPIHASIAAVDHLCMDAIETGKHREFTDIIAKTGNTVCGRHPIGIVMAAFEILKQKSPEEGDGKFKFVRYERSSLCQHIRDSSVSYCSAYAVLPSAGEKYGTGVSAEI